MKKLEIKSRQVFPRDIHVCFFGRESGGSTLGFLRNDESNARRLWSKSRHCRCRFELWPTRVG